MPAKKFCPDCGRAAATGHTLNCSRNPNANIKDLIFIKMGFSVDRARLDEMRKELRREYGVQLTNRFSILREYIVRKMPEEVLGALTDLQM